MTGKLFDKIYGCLAGSRVGSAMGVPVEGWSMARIVETYGVLDTFQPYKSMRIWDCPPGTTEDGIERQKLMCTAIIEKQDRITSEDLVQTWVKVLDLEKMRHVAMPWDRDLFVIAKTGLVSSGMLGVPMARVHLQLAARSFHPIALINACDTEGMIRDLYDVCRVYQPPFSEAFPWGVVYNAAIIEAIRPDATVDSVIGVALDHAARLGRMYFRKRSPKELIEQALEIASRHSKPLDMRAEMNEIYNTELGMAAENTILENVVKALAIFAATGGNVKDSVIVSVNFGRDTDCVAASAAGLAGAFSGTSTIPPEWIETVDHATTQNPYTNAQRTMKEAAQGLYGALQSKIKKMKAHVDLIESQLEQ